MLALSIPSPTALRAVAFAVQYPSVAANIPADILEAPIAHRSAVSSVLSALADDIESAPGPVEIVLTHKPGGIPVEVGRDVIQLLARMGWGEAA